MSGMCASRVQAGGVYCSHYNVVTDSQPKDTERITVIKGPSCRNRTGSHDHMDSACSPFLLLRGETVAMTEKTLHQHQFPHDLSGDSEQRAPGELDCSPPTLPYSVSTRASSNKDGLLTGPYRGIP